MVIAELESLKNPVGPAGSSKILLTHLLPTVRRDENEGLRAQPASEGPLRPQPSIPLRERVRSL